MPRFRPKARAALLLPLPLLGGCLLFEERSPSFPEVDEPAAPSNLVVTFTSRTSVEITWQDNSTNEIGFYIEFKQPNGAYEPIAAAPENGTSYRRFGLEVGMEYDVRVGSYNPGGVNYTEPAIFTVE